MKGTGGAFAFLIVRTVRNRIAGQLARIRTPRYAAAGIVGLVYVWLVIIRPGGAPPPRELPGVSAVVGQLTALGLALTVLIWWLTGGLSSALAFQPAEVQLLFPAPVSRRGLLVYKVVRGQLLLLLSCVIWAFLMSRWGVTLSAPLRFATAWGVLSVLSLHRLGAALLMVAPVAGGRRLGLWLGRLLAAGAALALVVAIARVLARLGELEMRDLLRALGDALTAPPAGYVLAPFRLVVAPLYASSTGEWLGAFAVVAAIVGLHLVWILALKVKFEEVAATASAQRAERIAAFKARRSGGATVIKPGKVSRGWLPLAPTGRPAVAIVWKNTVALLRTGVLRTVLLVLLILLVFTRVMAGAPGTGAEGVAVAPFATLMVMAFVIGPRMVRNDLRQDLLSLATLKTYPLSGSAVVAAEMASPALVLAAFQYLMALAGYFSLPASWRGELSGTATAIAALLAPIVLLALNAVSVAIQNGAALLFPGWVRLGPDSGGLEALGQNLLMTFGSILVLLVSLLAPALAGALVWFALGSVLGGAAGLAAGAAFVGVLAVELGMMVSALGRLFERTEPSALG